MNCVFEKKGDRYICVRCGKYYPEHLHKDNITSKCDVDWRDKLHPDRIREQPTGMSVTTGPGDHLHRLIKRWTGMDYTTKCGCENMVRQMNEWGIDGCREHPEEIVDKMADEAKKRGWKSSLESSIPFASKDGMRCMVIIAINLTEHGEEWCSGHIDDITNEAVSYASIATNIPGYKTGMKKWIKLIVTDALNRKNAESDNKE